MQLVLLWGKWCGRQRGIRRNSNTLPIVRERESPAAAGQAGADRRTLEVTGIGNTIKKSIASVTQSGDSIVRCRCCNCDWRFLLEEDEEPGCWLTIIILLATLWKG